MNSSLSLLTHRTGLLGGVEVSRQQRREITNRESPCPCPFGPGSGQAFRDKDHTLRPCYSPSVGLPATGGQMSIFLRRREFAFRAGVNIVIYTLTGN